MTEIKLHELRHAIRAQGKELTVYRDRAQEAERALAAARAREADYQAMIVAAGNVLDEMTSLHQSRLLSVSHMFELVSKAKEALGLQ